MEMKEVTENDKELLMKMAGESEIIDAECEPVYAEESRKELAEALEAGEIYPEDQESPIATDLSVAGFSTGILELRKKAMTLLGRIRQHKETIDTSEVQGKQIYDYLMIVFSDNEGVEASKIVDTLLERTAGKVTEDIQAMTDEEVMEMLTIDGVHCDLNVNYEESKIEDPMAYRKYVIDTLNQYNTAKEAGEKASAEAKVLIEENKAELAKLLADNNALDIPSLEYNSICSLMGEAKGSKEQLAKTLRGYDNGMSLEPIIELYSQIGGKNTIKDLQDPSRRTALLKKYTTALKEVGVHSSYSILVYVQNRLGEEYNKVPGLLSFACMKYIAGKSKRDIADDISMMLYTVIVAECIVADMVDESTEKKFMENCKKLLDILMA